MLQVKTTDETKFTVRDYDQLPEGFRAELLDGCLVKEPPPTAWHQSLVLEIARTALRVVGRNQVLISPTDVRVDRFNVLWPDVMVLPADRPVRPGDRDAATPTLVVEVLSPSTARKDRGRKTSTYLRAGVKEVWLVDPRTETIEVRTPDLSRAFVAGERAGSEAVPGFALTPEDLFHPA